MSPAKIWGQPYQIRLLFLWNDIKASFSMCVCAKVLYSYGSGFRRVLMNGRGTMFWHRRRRKSAHVIKREGKKPLKATSVMMIRRQGDDSTGGQGNGSPLYVIGDKQSGGPPCTLHKLPSGLLPFPPPRPNYPPQNWGEKKRRKNIEPGSKTIKGETGQKESVAPTDVAAGDADD